MTDAKRATCLVTGVGPGTGRAIVDRFASEYNVAMLARDASRLDNIAKSIDGTHAYPCDVSDTRALADTLDRVVNELGDPVIVIHNAVAASLGDFMSIDPARLQVSFEVNTLALLQLGQRLAPAMVGRGNGVFICTGNTAAFRGKANFAGFAPTKAAQRILAESMARSVGPQGVHVAYVAIDAVISVPGARERFKDKPADFFCYPQDIADHIWYVAHQPRSAWTFETVIRPFRESW